MARFTCTDRIYSPQPGPVKTTFRLISPTADNDSAQYHESAPDSVPARIWASSAIEEAESNPWRSRHA